MEYDQLLAAHSLYAVLVASRCTAPCPYGIAQECKYFREVESLPWSMKKIPRPRKEQTLPKILSKEDVVRLIEHAPTYKYQVFLTFMYATGMRMSEALNLRMQDIDGDRLQIRIEKGKGGKDRYIQIPTRLLEILRKRLSGRSNAHGSWQRLRKRHLYIHCGIAMQRTTSRVAR